MEEGKDYAADCLAVMHAFWGWMLLCDAASFSEGGWSCSVLSPSE